MPAPVSYWFFDETAASCEPIMITGKRLSATQETLYLLAVPGMRESIKAGMAEPLKKRCEGAEVVSRDVVFAKQALKDAKKSKTLLEPNRAASTSSADWFTRKSPKRGPFVYCVFGVTMDFVELQHARGFKYEEQPSHQWFQPCAKESFAMQPIWSSSLEMPG